MFEILAEQPPTSLSASVFDVLVGGRRWLSHDVLTDSHLPSSQLNLEKYLSLIRNIFNLTKLKLSFSGKDIFREKVSKLLRRLLMFLN